MRVLEKPQEKSYRPPRALKLDRHFPTMKFELISMLNIFSRYYFNLMDRNIGIYYTISKIVKKCA